MRLQKRDIPSGPRKCSRTDCVYNGFRVADGWCEDPRTGNGNSDSKCHRWTNKKLIALLSKEEQMK